MKKDHTCDDDYRIAYLKEYITEMKKVVEIDGVDLMGYTMGLYRSGISLFAIYKIKYNLGCCFVKIIQVSAK